MLSFVRQFLFKRFLRLLRYARPKAKHLPAPLSWSATRRVAILFDASNDSLVAAVQEFAARLRQQGKEVEILGYLPTRVKENPYSFPWFDRKGVNWWGKPTAPLARKLMEEQYEVMFCFFGQVKPLMYIAAHAHAQLRVGRFSDEQLPCFDLLLDLPNNLSPSEWITKTEAALGMLAA